MMKLKYKLLGYILFFITTSFAIGIGVFVFSLVLDKEKYIQYIALITTTIIITIVLVICDYIRRRVMIYTPLQEILDATKALSKGDFKVKLKPKNPYGEYDEFDLIKVDLNRMANELSKSEMLKNDFIANVSHEIKTPISIINNYIKLLSNDSLTKEEKDKYLANIKYACSKLSDLISNILKLNKLDNQRLKVDLKKFNLSESIINQIVQFEELIEQKEIELICDIEEDLYIVSEESYLEIIWNNLISNAIKFTEPNGTIKISLKKIENKYQIMISDTGIGMDKETGAHIFDKFYQGDTSRSKEGNGLGLALVKRVIDLLGGSISVESEINKGTTFIVIVK